jgi:hypothetical protein
VIVGFKEKSLMMNHQTILEQKYEIWIDSEAPSLLQKYKVPGIAVAVVQNDKVLYLNCWGVKCVDNNSPITPNTLFEAAL